MSYNRDARAHRIRNRSDMTAFLTHLTKPKYDSVGNEVMSALEVLLKILNERKILGSGKSGYVMGSYEAVCFQDVPLYNIAQNAYFESYGTRSDGSLKPKKKPRYSPFGIMIPKSSIWGIGGRPVIYEDSSFARAKLLPEKFDEWWRIVHMDLSSPEDCTDWSHEREWRVPAEYIEFSLRDIQVVVNDEDSFKVLVSRLGEEKVKELNGIIVLKSLIH